MVHIDKIVNKQRSKRYVLFFHFTSVFESIELGISLLIRIPEMLFLWLERLRLDQYLFRRKI